MKKIAPPALPAFIRKPQVRKMLGGMSSARVDQLVADGLLPAPIKLGERTTLFALAELEAALARLRVSGQTA